MWKIKKMDFFAKIAWHYLCQEGRKNAHFRAHYLFWPKHFSGPKQCKPGKTIKIVVSAEIAQNQKWHPFLEKVFLTWVNKWVLLFVVGWCCFCFCFCFLLVFFGLSFLFCFSVFLGRVYGSGEVAQRATSLGPKHSFYFFCFCFCVFLLSFLFKIEKPCFTPKKALFVYFCVFPFVSL